MSSLKFDLKRISQDDLNTAKTESRGGRYSGPTPPPGVYNAKATKLWLSQTKKGDWAIKVGFEFVETGDNKEYNKASFITTFMIPVDPSVEHFHIQVSSFDTMLKAISSGEIDYMDFQKIHSEDRIRYDKADKVGEPITQLGSLKLPTTSEFKIKTKNSDYNGNTYINLHYIEDNSWPDNGNKDVDDDVDGIDDDLDDILGS